MTGPHDTNGHEADPSGAQRPDDRRSGVSLPVLLELCRVSNLPTAWSNAFAGIVLSGGALGWRSGAIAVASVSLLYVGGMAMNDVIDAPIDAQRRSTRPIPSGRISRGVAAALAFGGVGAGVLVAGLGGPVAALTAIALAGAIGLYNLLHKKTPIATLFMGLCRAMIYPLAAAIAGGEAWSPLMLTVAGAACVYTLLLTLAARKEDDPGASRPRVLPWLVPLPGLVPLVALVWTPRPALWLLAAAVVGLYAVGHFVIAAKDALGGRTIRAVLAWLSGFCLLDALWVVAFGLPWLGLVPLVLFGLTVRGHRRIPGT